MAPTEYPLPLSAQEDQHQRLSVAGDQFQSGGCRSGCHSHLVSGFRRHRRHRHLHRRLERTMRTVHLDQDHRPNHPESHPQSHNFNSATLAWTLPHGFYAPASQRANRPSSISLAATNPGSSSWSISSSMRLSFPCADGPLHVPWSMPGGGARNLASGHEIPGPTADCGVPPLWRTRDCHAASCCSR